MMMYADYLKGRVFFPIEEKKDMSFRSNSMSGFPSMIKKPTDLQRMVHGYASIMETVGSFKNLSWYPAAAEEEEEEDDDLDALFGVEDVTVPPTQSPPKRAKQQQQQHVPRAGRLWIESWRGAGIAPSTCRHLINRDVMRMSPDEIIELPSMQAVWACLRYCESKGMLK